jgi:hypothetical protein
MLKKNVFPAQIRANKPIIKHHFLANIKVPYSFYSLCQVIVSQVDPTSLTWSVLFFCRVPRDCALPSKEYSPGSQRLEVQSMHALRKWTKAYTPSYFLITPPHDYQVSHHLGLTGLSLVKLQMSDRTLHRMDEAQYHREFKQ